MNALYNHAIKQKNQLQRDLTKFEKNPLTSPISLQGSISATLVSFEKTISQYEDYFKKQYALSSDRQGSSNNSAEAEKHEGRVETLRGNLAEFQEKFKQLKRTYNEKNSAHLNAHRREMLFGTPSSGVDGQQVSSSSTSENPFSEGSISQRRTGGAAVPLNSNTNFGASGLLYHEGLQKEQSIFERGNAQLEYILEMGQNSLNDIIEQNQILEGVQNKLTKSLRTLNFSEETIQKINRRLFKDKLIFWIGLILLFTGMYLVMKYLR